MTLRILMFATLMLSLSSVLQAQVAPAYLSSETEYQESLVMKGHYYFVSDTEYPDVTCFIRMIEDGSYVLEFDIREGLDLFSSMPFSYGRYIENGSGLLLVDDFYGYRMKFSFRNDLLIAEETFPFLKKLRFKKVNDRFRLNPDDGNRVKSLKEQIRNFRAGQKAIFLLALGEYQDELASNGGIALDIQSNHQYFLTYRQLILSEGNWTREENILKLWDRNIDTPLYAFIEQNNVITLKLSYHEDGVTFTKSRTEDVFITRKKSLTEYSIKPWDWRVFFSRLDSLVHQ